jgi:hypothetical protein
MPNHDTLEEDAQVPHLKEYLVPDAYPNH